MVCRHLTIQKHPPCVCVPSLPVVRAWLVSGCVLVAACAAHHVQAAIHINQFGPPHYPGCKNGGRYAHVACKCSPTGVFEAFSALFWSCKHIMSRFSHICAPYLIPWLWYDQCIHSMRTFICLVHNTLCNAALRGCGKAGSAEEPKALLALLTGFCRGTKLTRTFSTWQSVTILFIAIFNHSETITFT